MATATTTFKMTTLSTAMTITMTISSSTTIISATLPISGFGYFIGGGSGVEGFTSR